MRKRRLLERKGMPKKWAVLIMGCALLATNLAAAPSFVPRKSPELLISEPSGNAVFLSPIEPLHARCEDAERTEPGDGCTWLSGSGCGV